ncbi:MAG: hypothetical protein JSV63_03065 [Candidatus Aenigmatarchaeota archaeon]|nr:MAG: hypothetical protein JSV63_03065 [Candidatus Aenigmarchaeota archaeon]
MGSHDIVKALMRPEAYGRKLHADIELIQTHISWIFLTGEFAYKVKKPVDFGFLDFSTLEKRKKYCDLELELNRRLCPEIYLDVLPITEDNGDLRVNGSGETVEYALRMKQLPQDRLMNRLLERGEIGREVIDRIARIMADFHSKAATSNEISAFGDPDKLLSNWRENLDHTREFIGQVISMEDFVFVEDTIRNFMQDKANVFEKRVRDGKVRRIHGDMHSGNIFIMDGKPCIFDCIEFNMRFSCRDVAADVAFLSMDLDYKKRLELSGFLVDKYVEYSGDEELIKVLDFHKCYYAWVRGEVTAFRLREDLDELERKEIEETSKKYFRLALGYAKMLK